MRNIVETMTYLGAAFYAIAEAWRGLESDTPPAPNDVQMVRLLAALRGGPPSARIALDLLAVAGVLPHFRSPAQLVRAARILEQSARLWGDQLAALQASEPGPPAEFRGPEAPTSPSSPAARRTPPLRPVPGVNYNERPTGPGDPPPSAG